MRDAATINQLAVLSNMESLNSELIKRGVALDERKKILHKSAKEQLAQFDKHHIEHKFSKLEYLGNPKLLK